jgi:hypothetical protein
MCIVSIREDPRSGGHVGKEVSKPQSAIRSGPRLLSMSIETVDGDNAGWSFNHTVSANQIGHALNSGILRINEYFEPVVLFVSMQDTL